MLTVLMCRNSLVIVILLSGTLAPAHRWNTLPVHRLREAVSNPQHLQATPAGEARKNSSAQRNSEHRVTRWISQGAYKTMLRWKDRWYQRVWQQIGWRWCWRYKCSAISGQQASEYGARTNIGSYDRVTRASDSLQFFTLLSEHLRPC